MNALTAALLVTLLCLAGAAATTSAKQSRSPWWLVAMVCSVAVSIAMVFLLQPTARPQVKEAEKLFRAMEEKLCAAKSLEVHFQSKMTGLEGKSDGNGKALFDDGGRFRIEGLVNFGNPTKLLVIFDGKTLFNSEFDPQKPTMVARSAEADRLRRNACRVGYFLSVIRLGLEDSKLDLVASADDFKLGQREIAGKNEAQVVEFSVVAERIAQARIFL